MLSKVFIKDSKWFLTELARFTFYIALATWFILFLVGKKTNIVSDLIDLKWILGLSLVLGLVAILWGSKERDKHSRWFVIELSKAIFPVALITYLSYFLIENFIAGLISWYVNLNWILAICALSGGMAILFAKEEKKEIVITKKDYLFILVLACLGTVLIWWKTKELGWLSLIISAISGVLMVMISILLLKEENDS